MSLGAKGWLRAAGVDDAGRLTIPGKPRGRGADLVFDPDGLLIRRDDTSVMLEWSDWHGTARSDGLVEGWGFDRLFTMDVVSSLTLGTIGGALASSLLGSRKAHPIGGAVFVEDRLLVPDAAELGVPTLHDAAARVIPAWVVSAARLALEQIDTVAALCRVLAERPSLRPRLTDRARSERLARDLAPGAQRRITPSSGLRRASLEVDAALVRSGRAHRILGRPVPGDRTESDDHVVADVRALLDASPFADTFHVSDEQVAKRVHEHYLDVAPWPFAALTTD